MVFDFTWVIAFVSIAGSFFNIKKNKFCFYLWAICEVLCLIIDIKSGVYGRAFLDLFCLGMNIYGIISWAREEEQIKKAEVVKCE